MRPDILQTELETSRWSFDLENAHLKAGGKSSIHHLDTNIALTFHIQHPISEADCMRCSDDWFAYEQATEKQQIMKKTICNYQVWQQILRTLAENSPPHSDSRPYTWKQFDSTPCICFWRTTRLPFKQMRMPGIFGWQRRTQYAACFWEWKYFGLFRETRNWIFDVSFHDS